MNKREFPIRIALDFVGLLAVLTDKTKKYVEKDRGGKPFPPLDVTIEEHVEHKTGGQLRGFWRLCEHIAPYLQEMDGTIWNKDRVRFHIQARVGYMDYFKGAGTPKFLKDISKDDMSILINDVIVFGAEMDIPDCELRNDEKKAFDEYYKITFEEKERLGVILDKKWEQYQKEEKPKAKPTKKKE